VLLVGLTGGIGSGKSTAANLLAERGATILDADEYARAAVEPGTPGYRQVVDRFGESVLRPDGEIDRAALASIVFADSERLRALEAIVHPQVHRMTADALAANAHTDDVVVLVNPLLIEMGDHERCDVLVVVTAPPEMRIARLVARGMDEADARARMARQMPAEQQAALADVVLENDGSPEDLQEQVDALWRTLLDRASA
jgi:dephospho-CoA kinase